MSQVHEVIAAKQREVDQLLSLPGVTGVAVGQKYVDGKATDEVAIHVYVERKLAEGELRPGDRIPPTIGGHKTDVIEAGPFVHATGDATPDDAEYRPLQPGAQIVRAYSLDERAGTISCFVQGTVFRADGIRLSQEPNPLNSKPFLVTCAHVSSPSGLPISRGEVHQPSLGFGSSLQPGSDVVATVYAEVYRETVDAALCQLSDGVGFKNDIPVIGPITGRLTERLTGSALRPGFPYRVRKYGRTTRYTESTVLSVGGSFEIKEPGVKPGQWLHSVLLINPTSTGGRFADKGDSGAPVVNDSGELVGIVIGMEPAPGTKTVVCQAADVFDQLAEAMRARSGPDSRNPRYVGVRLELAPFTPAVLDRPPILLADLVPIYSHQSRDAPDRYFYDTSISSVDPEYKDGEEAFDAYATQQVGTRPVYSHFAPNPNRYYYDTRNKNDSDWSLGKPAFYAFTTSRPGAIPIYRHYAIHRDPDRYYYDTQIPNDYGWSKGQVAFWAYPKYSSRRA